MKKGRILVDDLLLYLLFMAIFKMEFIPREVRQALKITILVIVFFFLLARLKRKSLINLSLLYVFAVSISGFINYLNNTTTGRALIEGLIFCLGVYDLYTLIEYYAINEKLSRAISVFYNINLLYCILSLISIAVVGVGTGTQKEYIFGNKFSTSYHFLLMVALYAAKYGDVRKFRNRILVRIIIVCIISFYINCITSMLAMIIVGVIILLGVRNEKNLLKPIFPIVLLAVISIVPIVFSKIFQISAVHDFIYNTLGKSISIYGRVLIYEKYLAPVLNSRLIFGAGYNNGLILQVSNGVFGNAQNGLIEQLIAYGVVGVSTLLVTIYYSFLHTKNDHISRGASLIVYAMIAAATVEVTINWFFFLGLFIIRWNTDVKER